MYAALLDALFPSACAGCRNPRAALCAECIPRATRVIVRANLTVLALGAYESSWRRAVLGLKHGRRDVAEACAVLLAERAGRFAEDRATLIAGVPTTSRRGRERGFDQGALLAGAFARRVGIESGDVLVRLAGDAQRGRSRIARISATQRFACSRPTLVAGERVILVDDVVTTGSTLADCARALRESGASVTGAVVLAYA